MPQNIRLDLDKNNGTNNFVGIDLYPINCAARARCGIFWHFLFLREIGLMKFYESSYFETDVPQKITKSIFVQLFSTTTTA